MRMVSPRKHVSYLNNQNNQMWWQFGIYCHRASFQIYSIESFKFWPDSLYATFPYFPSVIHATAPLRISFATKLSFADWYNQCLSDLYLYNIIYKYHATCMNMLFETISVNTSQSYVTIMCFNHMSLSYVTIKSHYHMSLSYHNHMSQSYVTIWCNIWSYCFVTFS